MERARLFNLGDFALTRSSVPLENRYFEVGDDYASASAESNALWEKILPIGNGYFRIPNPRDYGLPESRPVPNSTEKEEVYLVTFAHQLHCVVSVLS